MTTTALRENTSTFSVFTKGVIFSLVMALLFSLGSSMVLDVSANGNSNRDIPEVKVTESGVDFGNSTFGNSENAWNTLLSKYRNLIIGVSAVAAVTMVLIFMINFVRLGASSGNPNARSNALVGLLWSGISAVGLGAVALIVGIFYNAID